MTNADRIRNLSDEELAEFLTSINNEYDYNAGNFINLGDGNVIFSTKNTDVDFELVKWLQSESEE